MNVPANPAGSPPGPGEPGARYRLLPRCDDGVFKARGDCVDTSAGPGTVNDPSLLPRELVTIPDGSRQLVFTERQDASVIASPTPLAGPIVYEFRLSHR
jgi:hypothetical protein